ncbi:MAG: VPLPA-CTERM sorting domain-containing protein [Pseudomonadota bacterium]
MKKQFAAQFAAVSVSLSVCLASSAFAAVTYNANLVTNGDAETGDLTGWVSAGVEVVPSSYDPDGIIDNYSFTGALGNAASQTLSQSIDISTEAVLIDVGGVAFSLGAALQNRALGGALDTVTLTLGFQDGGGSSLGQTSYSDSTHPSGVFDFDFVSDAGVLPVGARTVLLVLDFDRNTGYSSDGFADNISFALQQVGASAVPVPAAALLFGSALGGFAAVRRRKKHNI